MKKLILAPFLPETGKESRRHSCLVTRAGAGGEESAVLHYDVPLELPRLYPDDADPFVLAALMLAMKENRDLEIRGRVSLRLVENLEEWMGAWNCWKPEVYHVIRILPDDWAERDRYPHSPEASVAAFSGGVDASLLAWSWSAPARERSAPLRRAFFVHGFDIPLSDASYEKAYESAQATLESIGIPLDRIGTNFREVIDVNWEDACGIAIASCMFFYKAGHGQGLIASTEPYHELLIPWGSNPVVDHLMGSNEFRISHEGATWTRSAKIRELSQWPEGMANLRVCWQFAGRGGNCGVCEKCLRTKLSFWAIGVPPPASLGGELTREQIREIRLPSDAHYHEFRQILEFSGKGKSDDAIGRALAALLRSYRRQRFVTAVLQRIGLGKRKKRKSAQP